MAAKLLLLLLLLPPASNKFSFFLCSLSRWLRDLRYSRRYTHVIVVVAVIAAGLVFCAYKIYRTVHIS